jgi:DNA-binding PucR family transcriptional regulator
MIENPEVTQEVRTLAETADAALEASVTRAVKKIVAADHFLGRAHVIVMPAEPTIIVESHFQLDGFTTFARGARAKIDADVNLYRGKHTAALRRIPSASDRAALILAWRPRGSRLARRCGLTRATGAAEKTSPATRGKH